MQPRQFPATPLSTIPLSATLQHNDTATVLLSHFAVWGKYYDLSMVNAAGKTKIQPMRSRLELFSHTISPADAIRRTPDAVAVMMNPGGSQPLSDITDLQHQHPDFAGYYPARPDTTQYQIMRVMQRVGWQHVRVLNLSDFRAPKSADFVRFLGEYDAVLPKNSSQNCHSIFDAAQADELSAAIGECTQFILGWGVNIAFAPLAQRVLARLGQIPTAIIYGLKSNNAGMDCMYKHPLPLAQPLAQRAWVEAVAGSVVA